MDSQQSAFASSQKRKDKKSQMFLHMSCAQAIILKQALNAGEYIFIHFAKKYVI